MEDFLSHENRFPVLLRGAWFGMNKAFRQRIKDLGITTSQYTLMRCLHENQQGITQEDLSKLISSNKNNVSSLVKRLIGLGMIRREKDANDNRKSILSLTPKGDQLYLKARTEADSLRNEMVASFSPHKEEEFVDLLEQCFENLSVKN